MLGEHDIEVNAKARWRGVERLPRRVALEAAEVIDK
jgi:hypothetical protein